jgi:hypothetical protein
MRTGNPFFFGNVDGEGPARFLRAYRRGAYRALGPTRVAGIRRTSRRAKKIKKNSSRRPLFNHAPSSAE